MGLTGFGRPHLLAAAALAAAVMPVSAAAQDKPIDPNAKPVIQAKPVLKALPMPVLIKPVTSKPDEKPVAKDEQKAPPVEPAPAVAGTAPLSLPYRTKTPALEIVGGVITDSRAAGSAAAEFTPVRLSTAALEVIGGAASVTPADSSGAPASFTPLRIRTSPLEVVGTPLGGIAL